jgi:hypothetical protein
MSDTVSETLFAAARYVDEHGWTRGVGVNDLGEVCLYGALEKVSPGIGLVYLASAMTHLANFIRIERLQGQYMALFDFNDYGLESKEEAVKLFMEAAEWEDPTTRKAA